jgi:hypothetical protein
MPIIMEDERRKMAIQEESKQLHGVLEKLIGLHRSLCELLRDEHAHMIAVDLKGLADAAGAKESLLAEIWSFEQARIRQTEEIIRQLGIQPTEATLLAIADKLPSPDSEDLRNARTALNLLVNQARDLNTRNMAFAEESLSRIEELKRNALGLTNTATKENYSNSGARQPVQEQGGRLLSTEA